MARKTKEDAEKTRQNILDGAFDLFSIKGFTRTTLHEIAAVAGVTRGAIYWHFRDKVDLFMALWKEIHASAGVRSEDLRLDRVESLEDCKHEIMKYLEHFEINDRYAVFWDIVRHRTEYTEELEPVMERQRAEQKEILDRMTLMFARLKSHGRLRADVEPAHAALSIAAIVTGIIEIWLRDREAFPLSQTVFHMIDHVLRGMGTDD